MEARTDAELVALARAGNKDAFGQLIERYSQMAHRVALGRVADPEVARQLSQEAMLQAYLSLGNLRASDRFRSWLYGIVLNVCRSYVRGQKGLLISLEALEGSPQVETDRLVSLNPSPQAVVEEHELQREVLDAIQCLPPKSQAAAYLFYYEGLSVREIADTLGASASAVKGRLYRARQQLRDPLWPVYVARASVERSRRSTMATEPSYQEVMIADVIERGDRQEPVHVLVLLDKVGRRILPLWISPVEGGAIFRRLLESPVPRPLTHDLMSSLLQAVGATVQEVRVEALRQNVFFGVIKLRAGDAEHEVDARPSDAIALAVHVGCPIYAAESVLRSGGIPIPESAGELPESQGGIAQFVQNWEEVSQEAKLSRRSTGEEIESRQNAVRESLKNAVRQRLSSLIFRPGLQIGPDPNLKLHCRDESDLPVSVDRFYDWLSTSGQDWTTGITTTMIELRDSFFPWASRTPSVDNPGWRGQLVAHGDSAHQGIISELYGFDGGGGAICVQVEIDPDGAAALMRPPGQAPPFWLDFEHPSDDPPAFELYVRQLGPGPGAARRMVERIQEWDRAGRP